MENVIDRIVSKYGDTKSNRVQYFGHSSLVRVDTLDPAKLFKEAAINPDRYEPMIKVVSYQPSGQILYLVTLYGIVGFNHHLVPNQIVLSGRESLNPEDFHDMMLDTPYVTADILFLLGKANERYEVACIFRAAITVMRKMYKKDKRHYNSFEYDPQTFVPRYFDFLVNSIPNFTVNGERFISEYRYDKELLVEYIITEKESGIKYCSRWNYDTTKELPILVSFDRYNVCPHLTPPISSRCKTHESYDLTGGITMKEVSASKGDWFKPFPY